ncbi:hypothetical protein [uncultured Kriegella sp.]|uniref:hypothetical protein n=1 Tax=uncultured Kriegella sp. TaxID=1798910 RepID=UPI0030D99D59|tara:strand:- start:211089 stop:211562 length:474 start_codon:yes stop_codon:yes gene_type:complete
MEEKLEKLLLEKAFKALSIEEKAYVLSVVSESDYNDFRELLGGTKLLFDGDYKDVAPSYETGKDLRRRYRKKYQRHFLKSFLPDFPSLRFGGASLPIFKYAVFGIIFVFAGFLFLKSVITMDEGTIAMDVRQIPNFEEMNQYMYLDETCLNVEIIVP